MARPVVFDASALIAYVKGEPGAATVRDAFREDCYASAAQWSEVAAYFSDSWLEWQVASALLLSQGLLLEPVSIEDAVQAGRMRALQNNLSLGDRLCLALAMRLGAVAFTGDRAWGRSRNIRQIR